MRTQTPNTAALKELYKELEFYSLLRELGPEEDTRPRDYATLDTPEAVDAWLAAIPPGAPVAIAIGAAAPAEPESTPGFFSDEEEPFIGLAWQPGTGARRSRGTDRAAPAAARGRSAAEDRPRREADPARARKI